jgi:hypothetical protein
MQSIRAVIAKEWKCFIGSDKGMFFLYFILILIWSMLLSSKSSSDLYSAPLWLVFFSVVITANFSNNVFISERVSGALEIFITSGLSRNAILYGKLIFVLILSNISGVLCFAMSVVIHRFLFSDDKNPLSGMDLLLYSGSAFLNVASSAYLSVRMSNPRLLHFANMFLLMIIVGAYIAISAFYTVDIIYLILLLFVAGGLICWRAQILYNSEKILQPVYL